MADCKCGAPITWVQVDADVVPLERYGSVSGPRYVVTDFSTEPWTAKPLDPTGIREGHVDHRETCPFQR